MLSRKTPNSQVYGNKTEHNTEQGLREIALNILNRTQVLGGAK